MGWLGLAGLVGWVGWARLKLVLGWAGLGWAGWLAGLAGLGWLAGLAGWVEELDVDACAMVATPATSVCDVRTVVFALL